jgi:hypothetical protein
MVGRAVDATGSSSSMTRTGEGGGVRLAERDWVDEL